MNYAWLFTIIPFLIFMGVIVRFEIKQRRRETVMHNETERFMQPLARTTGRLFEKQYGHPSTDIERAFPEIRLSK